MPPDDRADAAHLVLYDGNCGFCAHTVQWILAADPAGRVRFAPLQGPTATALRARHPELPTDLDSVVYVDRSHGDERVSWRSDAVFRIARLLGRWRWLELFAWLPRAVTDLAYRPIARHRQRLSRAMGTCPAPSPALQARFLP
jgi:predicted DCC family thiol-disulfide oxidoreductase YuxK